MPLIISLIVSLCLLIPGSLRAEVLSWQDCLSEALRANPELQAAAAEVEAAKSQGAQSAAALLPQLNASVGLEHGKGGMGGSHSGVSTGASSDLAGVSIGGESTSGSAALNLSQSLYSGGENQARVRKSASTLDAAKQALAQQRAALSAELKTVFAALSYAQDSLELARRIISRRDENLQMVALRFQNGNENQGSVLLTRAALSEARYEELQSDNALSTEAMRLARALGRSEGAGLRVSGEVPALKEVTPPDYAVLLESNPQYRKNLSELAALAEDVKAADAALAPDLSAFGSFGYRDSSSGGEGDQWSSGLSLSVPLYSGGKNQAALEESRARHLAGMSRHQALARKIRYEMQLAWAAWREALAGLKVAEDYLHAAEVRAEIGRARYGNGLLSFEDWDRMENDLIVRQKALLAARREKVAAEAAWELATGMGALP